MPASFGIAGLLPFANAAAEAMKNATVAAPALNYACTSLPIAWPAAFFTMVKPVLFCAALATICVGAIRWLWVRLLC